MERSTPNYELRTAHFWWSSADEEGACLQAGIEASSGKMRSDKVIKRKELID